MYRQYITRPPDAVLVALAVVHHRGRVLLGRRAAGAHLAGYWELPGGKVGPGEGPRDAVAREVLEEVGLRVRVGRAYAPVTFRYRDRRVTLMAFDCDLLGGRARARSATRLRWVPPGALGRVRLPPANRPLTRSIRRRARPGASRP